jgi:SAM-dependent methyltransferase
VNPAGEIGFEAATLAEQAELEEGSFWFQGRNRLIAWAVGVHFPQARSFLEVGCGTGVVLAHLRASFPELELVGGEPLSTGLEIARERLPGVEIVALDGRDIPYEGRFDLIGAFDVLEHVAEDERMLAQMRGALRPEGGMILTVPQHPFLWSAKDDYLMHERRYRRGELVRKVEAAGFEVLRVTSFVSTLLPLMLASRFARRISGRGGVAVDELSMPEPLQRALGLGMRLDLALIRRGVSLPAGGSLLLVGRAK